MAEQTITIARIKRAEPRVFTILQPGTIPPRPKWMEGEPGYVESVARTCPTCGSNDVWRGVWCHVSEFSVRLRKYEPSVRHSGRNRHASCGDCGGFWTDFQAVPYDIQEEVELWWKEDVE